MAVEVWHELTKAQKKALLQDLIAETIDGLEKSCKRPADWQIVKVLNAIHFTMDGLFDVAATELDHILGKDSAADLWPEMKADFHAVTLEMLRGELDNLRRQPLQQWPSFWRITSF
jgi:hypothetical protein